MNTLFKKSLIFLPLLALLGACRKDSDSPAPENSLLFREISLEYSPGDWEKKTFATLNEEFNSYEFTWDKAAENSSKIHFGLKSGIYLVAPHNPNAIIFFNHISYGVFHWPARKGLTFDSEAVNDLNFDTLTKTEIDEKVPDAGFGGNDVTIVEIQQDKLIRFVFIDSNNVLKYKGYIKVKSVADGNPAKATVQIKYIVK